MDRKTFIKLFVWTGFFSLAWAFAILPKMAMKKRDKKLVIPYETLADGVNIFPEIILVKKESIKAFSRSCSHLGCALNKLDEHNLICPCHGSAFNDEGVPFKGPAIKNLKELTIKYDNSKKNLEVVFESL